MPTRIVRFLSLLRQRINLPGGLLQVTVAHDAIGVVAAPLLCPTICMVTVRGTPTRSRLRTIVRRKSCGTRPGQPAFWQAVAHDLRADAGAVLREPNGVMTPCSRFSRVRQRLLFFEHHPQVRGERKDPALAVLRRAWIESDFAGRKVNLPPLAAESRSWCAACDIGERGDPSRCGLREF